MITDGLHCNYCGQLWSGDPDDYPGLRDTEYVICSCGNPIARKEELGDEEPSVIQPAPK